MIPLSEALKTTSLHLQKLKKAGISSLADLFYFFPRAYKDLSRFVPVNELRADQECVLKGRIISLLNLPSRSGKGIFKGVFADATGRLDLIWFNQPRLRTLLRSGDSVMISGRAQFNYGKLSMANPNFELMNESEKIHAGRIIPIYSEVNGLKSKWLRGKIFTALRFLSYFPETLPDSVLQSNDLLVKAESLRQIHFPDSFEQLGAAQKRIGFEELFNLQLQVLRNKREWRLAAEKKGMKIKIERDLLKELTDQLPFELTMAQKRAVVEILNDLKKSYPMMRLLEGDVGSGKTVIAALAAFNTIRNGYQTALMAPTEVLAKQHFRNLLQLLSPLGVRVDFLSGSLSPKEKERIIIGLKTHGIDLVIGTHSLIQEKVSFANLGLAIIDEQHRFGVKQRDILAGYGTPHVLSLTATPIPRSLAMTIYGDQDLSVIDELPPGRKEIITRIVPENKRLDAYRWLENSVQKGSQAYVICPLISESETVQTKSALAEYEKLRKIFPSLKIAVLHGKMKASEKDAVMNAFSQGEYGILVSTTVIEVGIDVPNANTIFIEGAERFGLAQLHQLRGRVGRGLRQSYCFLFPSGNALEFPTENTRLRSMVKHASGFKLAEIDLEFRGPGEVYGVRQSGIPDLKMAKITDLELIDAARKAAESVLVE